MTKFDEICNEILNEKVYALDKLTKQVLDKDHKQIASKTYLWSTPDGLDENLCKEILKIIQTPNYIGYFINYLDWSPKSYSNKSTVPIDPEELMTRQSNWNNTWFKVRRSLSPEYQELFDSNKEKILNYDWICVSGGDPHKMEEKDRARNRY